MAQDIRELLRRDKQIPIESISDGHRDRFMDRLEKELPEVNNKNFNFKWVKIAASVVVIFSISLLTFTQFSEGTGEGVEVVNVANSTVKNATMVLPKQSSTLAEISPEYGEVENNILTSIKFQLSKITIDDSNRELVESFKKRLNNLDNEYQNLNRELIEVGPNVQSIEAMMENLTIRLSLLSRLKDKLEELERIENENYNEIQA
ncbi:hypothetical protein [Aquimarina pacifica]|uniref:hypothetical protein n=1 Tax=Aquimarina pacifica TaxID=1296415 RepID=UPI0004705823|nr:hypothetical protein [Aquimarina pacifica]